MKLMKRLVILVARSQEAWNAATPRTFRASPPRPNHLIPLTNCWPRVVSALNTQWFHRTPWLRPPLSRDPRQSLALSLSLSQPLGPSWIKLSLRVFGWGAGVAALTLGPPLSGHLRKLRFWVFSLVLGIWMVITGVPVSKLWSMFRNRVVLVFCPFVVKPWSSIL